MDPPSFCLYLAKQESFPYDFPTKGLKTLLWDADEGLGQKQYFLEPERSFRSFKVQILQRRSERTLS